MNPKSQSHFPLVDLLRGVAVFFLPISNAANFLIPLEAKIIPNYYFPLTQEMTVLWFIYHLLVELKLWYLLAIIFGISFALSQSRYYADVTKNRNSSITYDDFSARQYKRSIGLMIIGAIHGLIFWSGDILLLYAIVSCLLIVLSRHIQHPNALFVIMLVLLTGSYFHSFSSIGHYTLFFDPLMPLKDEITYASLTLSSEMTFIQSRLENAILFIEVIISTRYSYLWIILSLFLSGVLLVKLGYFSIDHTRNCSADSQSPMPPIQEKSHRWLVFLISNFRYSLLISIPMLIAVSYWQQVIDWRVDFGGYFYWYCFEILSMLLVFGVLSCILHYRHRMHRALRYNRLLQFFQTAGKLSLTLYLTQTIVLSVVSYFLLNCFPIEFKHALITYNQLIYWALGVCTLMFTSLFILLWPADRKGPVEAVMQWYVNRD